MQRQTITVKEAAEYIGISKDLVYQLVRENELPHLKLKRRILFRKAALDQWMHNQEILSFQYDNSIYSNQTSTQNNQGDC
ncbi:helix-turn-helix domain-containing protein [Priestia megaterium]|uniref:helix-turn-helix domain-containing protein n=1 Tax=Priestia megaterium TaxID=1404 RepID=UPI0030098818